MNKSKQYHAAQKNQKYPVTKKRYPPAHTRQSTQSITPHQFFQGNLVQNMQFGGKNHNLSGYVQRTVFIKDQYGNVQMAREKQFFNSSKNGMHINVDENDKNER